jgi:FtsP/CotA-like multicopper oxidase with cupredoxin domain
MPISLASYLERARRLQLNEGNKANVNRREFLESIALSVAGTAGRHVIAPLQALTSAHIASQPNLAFQPNPAFVPNVELELTARTAHHEILPGTATSTWSYSGKLLKGRAGTMEDSGSYLGPAIRLRKGDKVRVHFHHELPETTIVHWHGLAVPAPMDGHPRLVIPTGAQYLYEFEVQDRASHYWYHPHPDDRTGPQVYRGLAGHLFVSDDEESSLRLPSGEHEIPLIIQDRTFDNDHQLTYISSRMDAMTGFLGETILVNGIVNQQLKLATSVYRLRILNGSNSRIYKLAWSNGMPLTLIGTDGGLLERPLRKPYLVLGPAERADVILDLSGQTVGSSVELQSRAFPAPQMMMGGGMGRGMGRGMRGGGVGLEQGSEFKILRVRIEKKEKSGFRLPARLSQTRFRRRQEAENANQPRVFPLSFMRMQWLLNNSTFEMDAVKENETFNAGSLQVLEFRNITMGMMQMAHPIHLHGGQFQVLKRTPAAGMDDLAAALHDGLTDEGWKDTVLVLPGEQVQLLMRFPQFKGLFLYHCHILEHEDMGMMRNYRLT